MTWIFFFLASAVLQSTHCASKVNHVGCHMISKIPVCEKAGDVFEKNVQTAASNAIQWLRRQQEEKAFANNTILRAWILHTLSLSGYANDGLQCSRTIDNMLRAVKNASEDFTDLSGGKLAIVLLGLKANCENPRNFRNGDLIELLKKKMRRFPEEGFSNYYQYSLGMLALYVNSDHNNGISPLFGDTVIKMLRNKTKFEHSRKRKDAAGLYLEMKDTEALALQALIALNKQKFVSHSVQRRAEVEIIKGLDKIDAIMNGTHTTNFITLLHILQVLNPNQLSRKAYCMSSVQWIMKQQKESGSFGGVMETSYAIMLFNRRTTSDLRDIKCPKSIDHLNQTAVSIFVEERKKFKNEDCTPNSDELIPITVQLTFESPEHGKFQSVNVDVRPCSRHLDALEVASKKDTRFRFTTKSSLYGRFFTCISGVPNNYTTNYYWMIKVNGVSLTTARHVLIRNDVLTYVYRHVDIN